MNFLPFIAVLLLCITLLYFLFKKNTSKKIIHHTALPKDWNQLLLNHVAFYTALDTHQKVAFEQRIVHFLNTTLITGVDTDVTTEDKVLIGASAIIPIFHFPDWEYYNLTEVLLYSDTFDLDFNTKGKQRRIFGMVGEGGFMKHKMALSKRALHHGFSNKTDKKNTAVHEFVHLVDGLDGKIDGIPKLLLKEPTAIPWLELMNHHMKVIQAKKSDINPYGGTSETEFFAVASEYFFERPKLLQRKHPELYKALEEIFEH